MKYNSALSAVVANYRRLATAAGANLVNVTDEELWGIIDEVGTAPTSEEQTQWVVDDLVGAYGDEK